MQWRNTSTRYGHLSLLLHWGTALTVYGMFALGLWMVNLGYYDSWYHSAPEIHKSIGIILFIVLLSEQFGVGFLLHQQHYPAIADLLALVPMWLICCYI